MARSPKRWAFLFYLCGDNHIETDITADFEEICRAGDQPDVDLLVQIDTRAGGSRYLVRKAGERHQPDPSLRNVRVNTGDPKEAIRFLDWAVTRWGRKKPAHVALIFGGLGISPRYLRERLRPPESAGPEPEEVRVARQFFSICHDETDRDGLQVQELRGILEHAARVFGKPIDLVALDVGAAAFVEIAYQMEGLAQVLVASQGMLPDEGFPYAAIMRAWRGLLRRGEPDAADLGRLIVETVAATYAKSSPTPRMVAVDLARLDDAARALDALALALMQNLGVWHVFEATRRASDAVAPVTTREVGKEEPGEPLPAVDMMEFLGRIGAELEASLEDPKDAPPREFGQRERVAYLRELATKALGVLAGEPAGKKPLILHAEPRRDRGLSIFLPPAPPGTINFAESNYFTLGFSRRVHWAALVGAFRLIGDEPHVLWRLISAMLADAGGAARDALLEQLVSRNSVIEGLKRQFQ
ncbi:MAG: clostripain-related cysteine peptidase, partial [Candidatus Binatia bacterium]